MEIGTVIAVGTTRTTRTHCYTLILQLSNFLASLWYVHYRAGKEEGEEQLRVDLEEDEEGITVIHIFVVNSEPESFQI